MTIDECVNIMQSFWVVTVAHIAGRLCEVDVDDCVDDPCQHDGTCDDHQNGFACRSLPGYAGKLCSETVSHANNVTNATSVIEEPFEDRWYDQASHVQLCTVTLQLTRNMLIERVSKQRLLKPSPFHETFVPVFSDKDIIQKVCG